MDNKEMSVLLREEARELNLCDEWYGEWKDESTVQDLIDKYKRGIDFILGRPNFPSNAFIKQNVDKDLLNKNGIFVDEQDLDVNAEGVVILNGSNTGKLTVKAFKVANIYARHNSIVTVFCDSLSFVTVSVFDNANVTIIKDDGSRVFAYRYGGEVHASSEVVVRNREDFKFK